MQIFTSFLILKLKCFKGGSTRGHKAVGFCLQFQIMPAIPSNPANSINSVNFSAEILNKFIEKCHNVSDLPLEKIKEIWENDLKVEARKTFAFIPLELYETVVFKDLQNMTNRNNFTNLGNLMNSQALKRQRVKNSSKGSLRRSLTGSGSIGARTRTLSLIDHEDDDITVTIKYFYVSLIF